MKSFENDVIIAFQDIAKEIGAEIRRNPRERHCIEIPGKGITLRVYWQIERTQGVFVTIFKEADIGKRSKEYGLGLLIKFKNGCPTEGNDANRSKSLWAKSEANVVKKYAMGYLLGIEKDFSEFEEFVKQEREQMSKGRPQWSEIMKKMKNVRPEWIPEEED